MLPRIIFTSFFLFLLSTQGLLAQNHPAIKPGKVTCLAYIKGSLFAGTSDDGIFRSTDDGAHWMAADSGLGSRYISALCFANGKLFAGTSKSVFASTDCGKSWTPSGAGITSVEYYSCVGMPNFHPDPDVRVDALCAFGSTVIAYTPFGGTFRSTDAGNQWTLSATGPPRAHAFVCNGTHFFGGGDFGICVSSDSGATWLRVGDGGSISALATMGSDLFAGGGVARSSDNGAKWVSVNDGLDRCCATAFGVYASRIYVAMLRQGVFLSTNKGKSWTATGAALKGKIVTSLLVSGEKVFAGTQKYGVFISTDRGASWH